MISKTTENYTKRFVIYTYVLFWIMVLSLGRIVQLLGGNSWIMQWVIVICSWTPTIVLLVLFKKIFPESTVKDFYKKAFGRTLSIPLLLVVALIQMLIFITSVYIVSLQKGVPLLMLLDYSFSTIISGFFFTLLQGATGEESGWRGFLQPAIEEKSSIIKSSLIVGLIWTFWHAPLWFLSTGYAGLELIKYIVSFIICIISFAVIIGICYDRCKNLFVPIWMHFMLNFFLVAFIGKIVDLIIWLAVFYFITALGFILWHKNKISS
ncbi:CAAX protease self-immunity [Gottschalkia purinilytica]|uniref:CAAX protease self-immunity n=1 Tax=Gottschalkia purinilytica TaxID=1503 RepID=A0A0L0WCA0_GOTPU|nr:type II CAAX endopeptidase family protein [Gottschalkia purinilytica]KNF09098.1 CAAX protease self-immunity [Gottschalkia purinilytica]